MTSTLSPSLRLSGPYQAYLVRMWQDCPGAPWRASIQKVQTGDKRVFSDLEQLVAFLYAETQTDPPPTPESPDSSLQTPDV